MNAPSLPAWMRKDERRVQRMRRIPFLSFVVVVVVRALNTSMHVLYLRVVLPPQARRERRGIDGVREPPAESDEAIRGERKHQDHR